MDLALQKELQETIERLRKVSKEDIDYDRMDPIVKMMLVSLIHEAHSIKDEVDAIPQKIASRYCADFVPRENVEATPAIAVVNLAFKPKKDTVIVTVESGALFTYKTDKGKLPLNYIPLLKTILIPHSEVFVLTHDTLSFGSERKVIRMDKQNEVWVGIVTEAEIENLSGLSLLIKGTGGISPKHIYVGLENREIDFATMHDIENAEMLEPFDAQQSSGAFFSIISQWKQCLLNMDDASLIYVTDAAHDRDIYKPRQYPREFQQWLEDEALDCFKPDTLWLRLVFPEGYPASNVCGVMTNVVPVVNVDVNSLTLTPAQPIAKLQRQEGSFFLKILETSTASQRQGFGSTKEDVIVRDFDARCYDNSDLYRDVRNLYNKFIDNYYAFVEYNGIKDGEVLKHLRETINRLGKGVGERNQKYNFDSGTYVMKNMNQYPQTSSTKVSFATTHGKAGNAPKVGDTMENRKLPAIEQKATVVVPAMGGTNKATADERYELLRYYSLTNNRLYTKMDIDAFLRKEIMAEFGKEEFKRIFIKINIEGVGGTARLVRGLYIDIEFKDRKNYDKAVTEAFDKLMRQKIGYRSCIAMPIIVTLKNLEI